MQEHSSDFVFATLDALGDKVRRANSVLVASFVDNTEEVHFERLIGLPENLGRLVAELRNVDLARVLEQEYNELGLVFLPLGVLFIFALAVLLQRRIVLLQVSRPARG